MTLSTELKAPNSMKSSGLQILWKAWSSKFYEKLKAMDDMNDSESWAQGFHYIEQLWPVDDMNDSKFWVERSKYYKQLRLIDDMNHSEVWVEGNRWHEWL